MKTLLIIRHAKAETVLSLPDFERPLNDQGNNDATEMAMRLLQKNIKIDAFISSPAKRAKKTAQLFAEVYGNREEEIIEISDLYQAPSEIFYDLVKEIDERFHHIAVFGHNPGITHFANSLSSFRVNNMPTCAVFAVQCNISCWADFTRSKNEFLLYEYPKKD